jgi:UDP-N-acetylglucosamine:LPS N-acetylglucosamine transferase
LLDSPERLARMKQNARNLGKPRAAFAIVDESLSLIAAN